MNATCPKCGNFQEEEDSCPCSAVTSAGTQLVNELLAVITRYTLESNLTVYQIIGAVEVAKHAVLTASRDEL